MVMRLSLEGDRVKATGFIGKAQQELDRLQARMDSAQLDRGTFHYTLDDESYVYGYILPGGLRCARIVCTPGVGKVESIASVTDQIPDFLSGYVRNSRILEADPDDGNPLTEERPARVKEFVASVETKAKMQKDLKWAPNNGKMAVYAWTAFDPYDGSQHGIIKATMYTGRMRKLVQALLGFGKNPGKKQSFFGRELDFLTEEEKQKLKRAVPPAYALEVARSGLQIRYDHRFYRTHGLATAADNKQWVVEIGMNRGILAMPLLLHELTTTAKFRERVRNLGREEAITILDEFGGFPTGEAFPGTPNRIDAWVRAGRVLRLKTREDLSEFYSHSTYCSVMGWAFNTSGTEAHNTAWRFGDDDVQRGVHYAIGINIQASQPYEIKSAATGLWNALSKVDPKKESYDAVKWKVHRLDSTQISGFLGMLQRAKLEEVFDAVDAVECTPIAVASASITKVSEGKLYWPTEGGQRQIKFPEPLVGGLESHDLRPRKLVSSDEQYCDTTMFVMFAGNQLKYVKYFLDPRRAWPKDQWVTTGNTDWEIEYDLAGDLYRSTASNMQILPMFYGTDFDPREELPASQTETFYKRRAKWISDPWAFSAAVSLWPVEPTLPYSIINSATGTCVYRTHYFSKDVDRYYRPIIEKNSAVVVPFYDREAYYFADFKRHYEQSEYHIRGWDWSQDIHMGWRNLGDPIIDVRSSYSGNVEYILYQSQWTDFGPGWVPIGEDINNFNDKHHPYHESNRHKYPQLWRSWSTSGEVWAHYTVDLVTSSYFSTIRVLDETYSGHNASIINPLWFLPSPDEFGNYQFIGESHNVLGYIDCIAYGTHLLSQDIKHKGAYPQAALPLAPHVWEYPAFVGVFDA